MKKPSVISRVVQSGSASLAKNDSVTLDLTPAGTCLGPAQIEVAGTLSAGAGASSSEIALISKAQRMLQEATSVEEIRQVENLAQLARDCAAKAKHGRETVNSVSRVLLDARRKVGNTLKAMMASGELAQRGKKQIYCPGIYTLGDLGLTANESSHYQKEASVPPEAYEAWVRRVSKRRGGLLSPTGLRDLARRRAETAGKAASSRLVFAKAAGQLRRSVAKLWDRLDLNGKACLRGLLNTLAAEYGQDDDD